MDQEKKRQIPCSKFLRNQAQKEGADNGEKGPWFGGGKKKKSGAKKRRNSVPLNHKHEGGRVAKNKPKSVVFLGEKKAIEGRI